MHVGPLTVIVCEVLSHFDENRSEYCRVIKLSVTPPTSGNGHLTLHMYNSQQKLQIQGSSSIGGYTAPFWLYTNIIEANFLLKVLGIGVMLTLLMIGSLT